MWLFMTTKTRLSRRTWVILTGLTIISASLIADAAASQGRIESGVFVGSLDLSGRQFEEADNLLTARSREIAGAPASFSSRKQRIDVDPDPVAFFPDVDATLAKAQSIGRTGNLLSRIISRLRAYFSDSHLEWVSEIDAGALSKVVKDMATRFNDPGHEAGIRPVGEHIVALAPLAGRKLDVSKAKSRVTEGLETWPRKVLPLPFQIEGRRTDLTDANNAARVANQLIAQKITLKTPGDPVDLGPAELAAMLEAVPKKRRLSWSLEVRFSGELVKAQLAERMKSFETKPVDASYAVDGSAVSIRPSRDGLQFDPGATAVALTDIARSDAGREIEAAFSAEAPSLSTDQAKALNITEQVSSFTTNHPCCAPRVKNIHTIAEKVDGAIVRPGAVFSLNRYAGQRTTEKGYVLAPQIADGEFKDEIGGGVSQFATTFFNAIFFGGYEVESHRPHSYYISRYPPGREATISWPAPDVRFRNNSKSGILIKTAYSNTGVTVSFYGNKEGKRVTAEASERTNFTEPEKKRVPSASVAPGKERMAQKGGQGFDIVVFRIITQNGQTKRQRFFTRYKAQPEIIEFGPGSPAPSPSPSPAASVSPSPSPR